MKPIIILVITLPLNTYEKDLLFSPLNAIWEKLAGRSIRGGRYVFTAVTILST